MNFYKNISIIIVSYKSKYKVLKLIKNISCKFNIIIIENSKDQSLKEELKYSKNIKIFFKNNIGYGSAANFARNYIDTEYFLLCNPDLKYLSNKKIGDLYNEAKKLNENFLCLGPSYKKEKSKNNKKILKVKKISGACMLINKKIFNLINGFDENIFLYFEEDDLCRRGNKNKFYSYRANNIFIGHKIGSSIQIKDKNEVNKIKELTLWHFIWSKHYYFRKHYGELISLILFIPTLIRSIIKLLYFKMTSNKAGIWKYQIRLSGLLSSIKKKKSFKRISI